ncbi:winged helix-turn-helix transcriptional regulator [Nonomuraea maritima]|uniref:winged helix-turn-helix transcriptional regulator n=1 Tax=Nonomuraea maritima TaxID=683260 RepID=UPI0037179478
MANVCSKPSAVTTRRREKRPAAGTSASIRSGSRVEYALTDLGRSLLPLIVAIGEWAVEHAPLIDEARARMDGRTT